MSTELMMVYFCIVMSLVFTPFVYVLLKLLLNGDDKKRKMK